MKQICQNKVLNFLLKLIRLQMKKAIIKKNEAEFENLTEILCEIDQNSIPLEFEFFSSGKNEKFDEIVQSLGLSTDNLEFLYFLQSDICKQMLISNNLKIHVETGNIYYDNQDTYESIFDFFIKQQDPTKGIIDYEFVYGMDYLYYFDWLINGFNSYRKTKLDVLTSKNSKFLFYRYDEILKQSNLEVKKVKHSVVTDDYIAIEEIQSQNWQYFVESVSDACRAKNVSETIRQSQAQLLLDSVENVTICKKTYQSLYKQVAQNLNFTINNLPAYELMEINKDLQRENYWTNIETVDLLDCWCDFYFTKDKFPGSQEFIMV